MRKADNLLPSCAIVTKSGNLSFLGPSGPVTELLYLYLLDNLGFAISSVTIFMLSEEKGETGVRVYQEDVLQGVVKRFNMTFSGQECVFQQVSVLVQKGQDNSVVAAMGPSDLHQCQGLTLGECRSQNPGQQTVDCFGKYGFAETFTTGWTA